MNTSKRTATAFTLIELLVVVAIIAVLVSVLMPSLSVAKAQSRKSKCVGNLREIMRSAIMYAHDDPRDVVGPIHPESPNFILEGYAHYGGGAGDMPYQDWEDAFDPRTRPLNWLIYGGPDTIAKNTPPGDRREFVIFQCPGDDFGWQEWPNMGPHPQETERSYFFSNGTSYRMNNLTDVRTGPGATQTEDEGGGGGGSPVPVSIGIYGRQLTQIPDTSVMVCFMEARAFQTLWTNNVWAGNDAGELTGSHQKLGFFNLAYADGHVNYADMGDDTYYQQSARYNLLDVRGTWGHMDVFPAEPIPEP